MKTSLIYSILIILLLSACQKTTFNDTQPESPENLTIDMDEDGQIDYKISYSTALIFSTNSDEGIICHFESLEENKVLTKHENPLLFLENQDDIEENVASPLEWEGSRRQIACIKRYFDIGWSKQWEISSNVENDTFIIGVNFKQENNIKIGWIEIKIDVETGRISVIDKVIL